MSWPAFFRRSTSLERTTSVVTALYRGSRGASWGKFVPVGDLRKAEGDVGGRQALLLQVVEDEGPVGVEAVPELRELLGVGGEAKGPGPGRRLDRALREPAHGEKPVEVAAALDGVADLEPEKGEAEGQEEAEHGKGPRGHGRASR